MTSQIDGLSKKIETLLVLIQDVVDAPVMTWKEKKEAVLQLTDSVQRTNLEEFASWFAENETEEGFL